MVKPIALVSKAYYLICRYAEHVIWSFSNFIFHAIMSNFYIDVNFLNNNKCLYVLLSNCVDIVLSVPCLSAPSQSRTMHKLSSSLTRHWCSIRWSSTTGPS